MPLDDFDTDKIAVNDNKELVTRASNLLVRMCGVSPPTSLINPILGAIFDAIHDSPSWRVRLKALPLLQGRNRHTG